MPPRVLSHDAYTIAWICALPLEMAAAKLMLEEVHGNLPQPSTDHNCYTLASIHGHNIVIACLPSGVYGTISATTALAQMLPTFRSLRFALMVGIGGGVPTKADVRLGDVVVGIPSATSGGVIQYDHGKTLHSGRFERVGALNKPPQVLLTAVSQLRSNDMVGRRSTLTQAISKDLSQGRFSRPDRDLLFNPEYIHHNTDVDCSTCDQDELVHREPRQDDEPRIHYGLIASGNQVLKDAKTRDSIAHELDILCFEMEAAGLVDQLQCLVVRGVCDYCDSHKSKEWQEYAALAAAAYTKILLQIVPVHRDKFQKQRRHWMVPLSRNKAGGDDGHVGTPSFDQKSPLSPAVFAGQATNSPSKVSVLSRKQNNQPSNRVHDIEFATEISTSLLAQVRQLQTLLAKQEDSLKAVNLEKSRLELETKEYAQQIRALEKSEEQYKNKNWVLEIKTHELIATIKEATDRETKLNSSLEAVTAEKSIIKRELEDLKQANAKLIKDYTATQKANNTEIYLLYKNLTAGDTKKVTIQQKLKDINSQN